MKRWFVKSLNHKLSMLILLAVMVPLLFLGIFTYQFAANVTQEKTKESGQNILRQLETNLEFITQDVESMSISLIGQKTIQDYLMSTETNIEAQSEAIAFLNAMAASKPYISDITIFPQNTAIHYISSTTIVKSGIPDITKTDPEFFEKHAKWWSPVHNLETTSDTRPVITLVRPVRSIGKFHRIGMLTIGIRQEYIESMLKKSNLSEGGSVLLLDGEDRILAGSNRSTLMNRIDSLYPGIDDLNGDNGSTTYGEGDGKQSVLYETVPLTKWKLVGFIPFRVYKMQNQYVLQLTALAAGIAFVLVVVLVLSVLHWVTRPLKTLTRFLKEADPERPIPTYYHSAIDEVGQLTRSYNKLTDRIEHLTEQVKKKEALKKEMDMQALQFQINPHFLYNTLSSIHWMALMNKEMKIAEMVGALSDFLRFSLNKGLEFCSVEQEVAHAKHYGTIQAIRYPDKFNIRFFIDVDIENRIMLKLLLQPLIENALIHGILKMNAPGTIYVHGHAEEKRLVFVVEDNGVGIVAMKLRELREGLNVPANQMYSVSQSGGYGLRNVHQRLLLHYGADSGLKIESTEGQGTKISFFIPNLEDMPL